MLNRLDLQKMKNNKQKISMITAYDYPSAQLAEKAGVDMILVGDSLGMVVLGYPSTIHVTVEDMIYHTKAVKRGAKDTFVVVDMPFMSYHISTEDSLKNAKKMFQETDAQALKIEGASDETLQLTKRLSDAGIPVVSHIGLTPQSINVLGTYQVQGKDEKTGQQLINNAKQLEEHGAIALVLECVPKELGKRITESISIPTIGIGSGVECDGQVLVFHDLVQFGQHRLPKFVKSYANFHDQGLHALEQYVSEVKKLSFPSDEYSFLTNQQMNNSK